MSLRARKPLIISFVLGAIALGAVMVYAFGGREIFARHATFLIYFDDTVSGLVPGSMVRFKGVPVGEVKSIRLDYRTSNGDRRIPVLIQINVDRLQRKLGVLEDVADPEVLANRVKRGLRAELEVERYLTGEMYVELDFHTPPPPFVPTTPPDGLPIYGVIPTVSSEAVANLKEAQDIIAWLPTFDFKGEIDKVGDQIDSVTNVVAAIPYAEYNQAVQRTLGPLTRFNFPAWDRNFNNFFNRLDRYQTAFGEANDQFYSQSQDFVAMNGQARGQLGQYNAKLAALRASLSADDPSMAHLTHNFEQLSKDLQNLTDKLDAFEQQPGVLDKMTPPARSK